MFGTANTGTMIKLVGGKFPCYYYRARESDSFIPFR